VGESDRAVSGRARDLLEEDAQVLQRGSRDRELVFETETGAYQFCETRDGVYRCRSTNDQRQWRGYRDPPLRR
jgi:hypothetical protein